MELKNRLENTHCCAISNKTGEGMEKVKRLIQPEKTYCLLGSSGVGKSSLINSLSGKTLMAFGKISSSIDRGKHITTHRELIVLESGGMIIDNPGMREVGITESSEGIETTFDQIYQLAKHCKFKNCRHTNEKGCAVLEAIKSGILNHETYENFLKLEKERTHFSSSIHEKRKKDRAFGKMVKQAMSTKYNAKR